MEEKKGSLRGMNVFRCAFAQGCEMYVQRCCSEEKRRAAVGAACMARSAKATLMGGFCRISAGDPPAAVYKYYSLPEKTFIALIASSFIPFIAATSMSWKNVLSASSATAVPPAFAM